VQYDIANAVRIEVADDGPQLERELRSLLDPWTRQADQAAAADVSIDRLEGPPRAIEMQNPAGDGLAAGWDGSLIYVRERGRWCAFAPPTDEGPFTIAFEHAFPIARAFRQFVRPALQIAASARGVTAVHGSAVVDAHDGVIVAGWSESGKTETALAFMEQGARFVSDKWTFLFPDASMSCFPISVGIRRWMLGYAPRLRAALPRAASLQFALAGATSAAAKMVARLGLVPAAAHEALDRAVALADRAALSPTAISAVYGQPPPTERVPLRALVLLTTVTEGEPVAVARDAEWAAPRLARSATYERRSYLDLPRRLRYSNPESPPPDLAERIEKREEEQLRGALQNVRVIEVRATFPCDPQRIVAAARPLL
jgi:hypothetical protein